MKKKILIADHLHPVFKEEAELMGFECHDLPLISREEALGILDDYEVIAIRTKFQIDRELISAGKKLQVIARAGAGLDNIDEQFARSAGITCINAPEGNRDAVAEHVIGMLLGLANKLAVADREIRSGKWDREGNRGWELKGKTVAIIGYGNTGQKLARKLQGFECRVIAYDKYHPDFENEYAESVDMEEIFEHADVLSFHVPLRDDTRFLFNDRFLSQLKKQIILINASRGEVVDTKVVLDGIRSGQLRGAALDVLEVEKFPALAEQTWYPELASSDKVLLSPHVAGWTVESYRKISEVLAAKLKAISL